MNRSRVHEVFQLGRENLLKEEAEQEKLKSGVLRGGSGGLTLPNGKVVGCQRKAALRFTGIDIKGLDVDYSVLLMFESGRANEDQWVDVLAKGWDGPILREEELQIEWTVATKDDVRASATGRPDVVLCVAEEGQPKPHLGLELKLVSSAWTARDVIKGEPKLDHLRQAATYMWKLSEQVGYEVPFELWYASRVNFPVSGPWMVNLFPKYGEKGHEYCKYVERKDRKTGQAYVEVKDVLPFVKGYALKWTANDGLAFRAGGPASPKDEILAFSEISVDGHLGPWQNSVVSKQAIDLYYAQVLEQATTGKLGPRPVALDPFGKSTYDPCGYCPLKSVCDNHEATGYAKWLEAVQSSLLNAPNKKGSP